MAEAGTIARPPRRVLRAETVVAIDAAELERAAQRARQEQDEDLQELLAAAHEQGRAAGAATVLAEGTAAVLRAAGALEALTAADAQRQQHEDLALTDAVIGLALQVSEWVLRHELSADGRGLLTRLEQGLTALLPSPTTRISVSHADHDLVAEWAQGRGRVGTTVVADSRLEPGSAVVVTDAGRAELTVAAALRTAGEALGLSDGAAAGTGTA